jgi:hypothetical protein
LIKADALPPNSAGYLRLLNLELLDRVDRRVDHEVVEQFVGDLEAIEQVDVVARSLAADVWQWARLLQRVAARAARRQYDAIAELCKGQKVPAVQWNLNDLAILDDVADLRIRAEQRRIAGDNHILADTARLELEVDGECLA